MAKTNKTAIIKKPEPATFDELLESRMTGNFYIGDDETPLQRLSRILPELGFDAATVAQIVERYYADRQRKGPKIVLRVVTREDNDMIKALCKTTPRDFDTKADKFVGGEIDKVDYTFKRLAFAIVEPPVPGKDLQEKADYLSKKLSEEMSQELLRASLAMNRFDLGRVEEQVKN